MIYFGNRQVGKTYIAIIKMMDNKKSYKEAI